MAISGFPQSSYKQTSGTIGKRKKVIVVLQRDISRFDSQFSKNQKKVPKKRTKNITNFIKLFSNIALFVNNITVKFPVQPREEITMGHVRSAQG